MNKAFIICRHKRRGNSSWVLEQSLREQGIEAYRVTPHRLPLRSREWSNVYINYGNSQVPVWWNDIPSLRKMYNTFDTVRASASKLRMQRALVAAEVPCLEFTRRDDTAAEWIEEGHTVVCRRLDRSHSGRGIVLASTAEELCPAKLYTKLFDGEQVREYRVFIVDGIAVDIVEKRRRGRRWCREHNVDRDSSYSQLIRSWHNGWVFARNTMQATPAEREIIKRVAERGAAAVALGIGGVDMIVNREDGELSDIRVVETNTSLGIDLGATSTNLMAEALAVSIGEL